MIKMFLDDSLHHTYNYVDQPFYILCCYVTLGHYLISILSPSAAFMMRILINYYKTIHIAHYTHLSELMHFSHM